MSIGIFTICIAKSINIEINWYLFQTIYWIIQFCFLSCFTEKRSSWLGLRFFLLWVIKYFRKSFNKLNFKYFIAFILNHKKFSLNNHFSIIIIVLRISISYAIHILNILNSVVCEFFYIFIYNSLSISKYQ